MSEHFPVWINIDSKKEKLIITTAIIDHSRNGRSCRVHCIVGYSISRSVLWCILHINANAEGQSFHAYRTSAAEFYTNTILNTANEIDIICRIYTAHNHEMLVSLLASVLAEKPKRVPLWTDVQHTAEFTVFQPVNLSFTSGLLADGRNCFKLKLNHSIDSSHTSHHCSHGPFRNTV